MIANSHQLLVVANPSVSVSYAHEHVDLHLRKTQHRDEEIIQRDADLVPKYKLCQLLNYYGKHDLF